MAPENEPTRRSLLKKGWIAAGCAACAMSVGPIVSYLIPQASQRTSGPVAVAKTGEIPEGGAKAVQFGAWVVLLIKKEGRIIALNAKCTHLGCIVSWDEKVKMIRCPCHGGQFDADGKRLSGPPPRDLSPIAVRVVGDKIILGS